VRTQLTVYPQDCSDLNLCIRHAILTKNIAVLIEPFMTILQSPEVCLQLNEEQGQLVARP